MTGTTVSTYVVVDGSEQTSLAVVLAMRYASAMAHHGAEVAVNVRPERDEVAEDDDEVYRPCPEGAALLIAGEHYPCDAMRLMSPDSDTHQGWPHASRRAEAIWTGGT